MRTRKSLRSGQRCSGCKHGAVYTRSAAFQWLENRLMLSSDTLATATAMTMLPSQTAHASGYLANPSDVDFYRIQLGAGTEAVATVAAQSTGSALQSTLRVFNDLGQSIASDDQEGGDPRLTFQVPVAGDYFLGISSAGNDSYDPHVFNPKLSGTTQGLFSLDLRCIPAVPATADLAGSRFRVGVPTAAWGDTVPVSFTVENRGGGEAGNFEIELVASSDPAFGASSETFPLQAFAVAGLGSGQAYSSGDLKIALPDFPDSATAQSYGLPASGPIYLGLIIDPVGQVAELNPHDQSGVHRGEDWEALTIVTPVTASGDNLSPTTAEPLPDPNGDNDVFGSLVMGQSDWYQCTVPQVGQLSLSVEQPGESALVSRLTLADQLGTALIQSDSGSIAQFLEAGTYDLEVTALSGSGNYQLTSQFVQADNPAGPLLSGNGPDSVAVADLGNGRPDLIVANSGDDTVGVLLGNGDGTFQPQQTYAVGITPDSVAVADLGNGELDLIVADNNTNTFFAGTVSVLLGNGDGTFQPQQTYAVGNGAASVAVADLGNGLPDLVVANENDGTVSVLLGNGDGTFQPQETYAVGGNTDSVAVADLGNGRPDLIVANSGDDTVGVLLGNGDGTFQPQQTYAVGLAPDSVAVADLGNGRQDLIVANQGDNSEYNSSGIVASDISVLLGNGDGTFQPQQTYAVGLAPTSVAVADVNGDGRPDVIVANSGSDTVSVLLGNGDGTFQPQQTYAVGENPESVAVADVNNDGRPDLIVANQGNYSGYNSSGIVVGDISVLPGNGDGTFQAEQQAFTVGAGPQSVAVADVNRDGRPDVIAANSESDAVSVLLGNGDGTFQPQQTYAVGSFPTSVAVADVNGDGRPDLIVANSGIFTEYEEPVGGTVSVLLGNGDGTFQPQQTYAVGNSPSSVAVADLGNGRPDLVVTNFYNGTVSVLLGNGDGTFQPQQTYAVGNGPESVAVADLGNGQQDLIVANQSDGTVSVLLGSGDGTFQPQQTYAVGGEPDSVAVADLGNGQPDLIVVNESDGTVSVLLGNGDGTFHPQQTYAVGLDPTSVAVADLGNGRPDLVVTNFYNGTVSVLLGNGDGTFQPQQTYAVGSDPTSEGCGPTSVAVADVNGDGRPDLIVTSNGYNQVSNTGEDGTVSVLLNNGSGFTTDSPVSGFGLRNTPYLADLNGDGIPDSVILDGTGKILYRQGLPGGGNQFDPPVILNADGPPARDLTVLNTGSGWAVAAADESFDPALSAAAGHLVYAVSLYTVDAAGTAQRSTAMASDLLPTSITAGDLTGNGLDDLVVGNALDDSVTIAFQVAAGKFSAPITLPVGVTPSDIAIVDVNGLNEIVVTDQASGEVCVLVNDDSHSFTTSYYFRAATGLYGLNSSTPTPTFSSLAEPIGLAAGDFMGNGLDDLTVVNRGSESFTVLPNDGYGGFLNPQPVLTTPLTAIENGAEVVGSQSGPIVAGDFVNGTDLSDLAILMEGLGQVWVYTNAGNGTFSHPQVYDVGAAPTGLSLCRDPQTGFLDLLVGDPSGDILQLQGNGDGTFKTPSPITGKNVDLAYHDADGQQQVLLTDQQQNQVVLETRSADGQPFAVTQTMAAENPADAFAPTAAQWLNLDENSTSADAVWVGSGSNSLYIRRFDSATQTWNTTTYAVGTDPVSVTMQDIQGDGIPDLLIADKGSNDIYTLFGSYDANGDWIGTPGPRLAANGTGAIAATTRTLQGQTTASLIVTDAQSGTISVSPGVGQGFFADQKAQILTLPGNPTLAQAPVFDGPNSDSGTVLTTTGQLIDFNLDTFTANVAYTPPPGQPLITAIQAIPGGVVAAEQGGNLAVLQFDAASGTFQQTPEDFTAPSGIAVEPSALAVLSSSDFLVTSAGDDQIFEYLASSEPAPIIEPGSINLPLPVVGEAETQTSSPRDASLVLVVSLIAGVLINENVQMTVEKTAVTTTPGVPIDENGGMTAENVGVTAMLAPDAGNPSDDSGQDMNAEGGSIGIDVEKMLQHINLNPQTENLEPDPSDVSWRAAPGGEPGDPAGSELFWQTAGEAQGTHSSDARSAAVGELPSVSGKDESPAADQTPSPSLGRPDSVWLEWSQRTLPAWDGDGIDARLCLNSSIAAPAELAPHFSTERTNGHAVPAAEMVDSVLGVVTAAQPVIGLTQAASSLAAPDLSRPVPVPIHNHVWEQAFLLSLAAGGVARPMESNERKARNYLTE